MIKHQVAYIFMLITVYLEYICNISLCRLKNSYCIGLLVNIIELKYLVKSNYFEIVFPQH
jgi:hypothetical protein